MPAGSGEPTFPVMPKVVELIHESYAKDRRSRVLVGHFADLIPEGASVLDVGTGDGAIAAAVRAARPDIDLTGLEFQAREDCAIPVETFDGRRIPRPDNAVDYVSFLDVLHHTENPMVLLREAVRVARRGLIIKDHLRQGFLAGGTLAFMDRVGNRRYGIELPQTYWPSPQWESAFARLDLIVAEWRTDLKIYPPWGDWIFGRGLHFFARMDKPIQSGLETLEFWHPGLSCCNERWEAAYDRFETPAEERAKFRRRFHELGIDRLPREAHIVDIFCGRGNGLAVLKEWKFTNLTGVDLSPDLLRQCPGSVRRIVADCTDLKFPAGSIDAFIVQGGLHHLARMPEDLEKCLQSVHQALKPGGTFYAVEPWDTPFLRAVHRIACNSAGRALVPRFDAFATMVEEEQETYDQWLRAGAGVERAFRQTFASVELRTGWGKANLLARKEQA